jgi:methyl-accepting chemotaxis protein
MVKDMKKNKSIFTKILVTMCLPTTVIYIITSAIMIVVMDSKSNQFLGNQFSLVMIVGLGIAGIILISGLTAFSIGRKVTIIDNLTSEMLIQIATTVINNMPEKNKDQLDRIIDNSTDLNERLDHYIKQAKKLGDGFCQCEESGGLKQDEFDRFILSIEHSFESLVIEMDRVSKNLDGGDYLIKREEKNLHNDYKTIIGNVNQIMTVLGKKIEFYEAVFDALPFPIHVMDNEMKWLYMNKGLEDALQHVGALSNGAKYCGMDCSNAHNPVCNTEQCGIQLLTETGVGETTFVLGGQHVKLEVSYLSDKSGNKIGFVEVCTDITAIAKVNDFAKVAINRLENNLLRLVKGNLDFDLNMVNAEKYTEEISDQFAKIDQSFIKVKESIGSMICDVSMMTTAAIEGKLETRADETRFTGAWQDLIAGMNNILVEIETPLLEIEETIKEMSDGNLNITVAGAYRGSFDHLKLMVNVMVNQLKTMIEDISYRIGELASGNLNIENAPEYKGDFSDISNALNGIIESFNPVMRDIYDSADQVSACAGQVADGSQALAQGSTEQASAIQELTASITEIADQTKSNAMDANQARELTAAVMMNAKKGNVYMNAMQQSMVDINTSSQDISKIIKVIDDIAFQTNILALNAAVEAARAGQHGKGFAVVAEEVRSLAARSADAAKETTALIEGSISKVEAGTKITNETAAALTDIVGGIEKITDLVSNIAVASNEQATGIAQINVGIEQVAQVVSQNSATAEESAAASEEMSSQAEVLKERIKQFQLREI